jgi:hypothetical protein
VGTGVVQVFGRRRRELTTRSADRRPKSAKARNRVRRCGKAAPRESGAAKGYGDLGTPVMLVM